MPASSRADRSQPVEMVFQLVQAQLGVGVSQNGLDQRLGGPGYHDPVAATDDLDFSEGGELLAQQEVLAQEGCQPEKQDSHQQWQRSPAQPSARGQNRRILRRSVPIVDGAQTSRKQQLRPIHWLLRHPALEKLFDHQGAQLG